MKKYKIQIFLESRTVEQEIEADDMQFNSTGTCAYFIHNVKNHYQIVVPQTVKVVFGRNMIVSEI